MGHKATKVCEGPLPRNAKYSRQEDLYLRRQKIRREEAERSRKTLINSNNSNELDSVIDQINSFNEAEYNHRYPKHHSRSQLTFRPKEGNSSYPYHQSKKIMKKIASQPNSNTVHLSSSDEFDSTDEEHSVGSCNSLKAAPISNNRITNNNVKDRRSRSVGKNIIQNQDEKNLEKCLFNVLHRKESQRFCRALVSKNTTVKANRDSTGTIVLSDGRLYNRSYELIKDTRKNVEFASDRVTDFKRLAATLEQMDASLQTLPKRLANGFSKILDFDVFSEVDESLQMEIISTARNSCSILSDTIPSLQKHIENIRDIQMILVRTEERMDTFCKALYQMFHIPDLNTVPMSKRQNKRDGIKGVFKSKKS